MKPADKEILSDLRRIIRSVNLEAKRVEREFGVSIPQYLCLQHLNEQAEFTASMKEIKDVLQLNASTATGIVQRLERGGYVAKLPKRKSLIVLTERGAEVVKRNPQILHERLLERLQELGPEDYANLRSAFRVIIEFLEIERIDAAPIVTSEAMLPNDSGQRV
jgi:DNA-binding MarR family transcriptional regulator